MTDHFNETAQLLWDQLGALGNVDAQRKLKAVEWTVRDGPAIGLQLAEEAGDRMKEGRDVLAHDLLSYTVASYHHTSDCYDRSRFALESTVRYLHAGGDLAAQMVNDALGLGLPESKCNLWQVRSELSTDARRAGLYAALNALSDSTEFKYVAAATNRMKHADLMSGEIKASMTDADDVDVTQRLLGFSRKGQQFPEAGPADIAVHAGSLRDLIAAVLDETRSALP